MTNNQPKPQLTPIGSAQAAAALAPVTHIYSDLDGTLFAPGGRLLADHAGRPSFALAKALVALQEAGIEVIISTGRNGSQGHEILRLLGLTTFIGELGTLAIEGTGALAKKRYFLGDWANVALAPGLPPGVLPAGLTPYQLIIQSGAVEQLLAAFPGQLEDHGFVVGSESDVTVVFRGNLDTHAANALLAAAPLPLQLVDNGIIHPLSHTLVNCDEVHIYHLVPLGTSKAAGVAADMAARGLSAAQTVAIGDSLSDIGMGDHTGSFVMMANGLDSTAVWPRLAKRHQAGQLTFSTREKTADGWVEFAHALLAAKG